VVVQKQPYKPSALRQPMTNNTSSSSVAKRPRDASRPSVVSFNSTVRRAQSSITGNFGFRFTALYKYRNGLLPMQYVFLIRSSVGCKNEAQPSDVFLTASTRAYQKHVLHGPETVSIFIANLHAIFNDILRKNHGTLLYCGRSAALRQ